MKRGGLNWIPVSSLAALAKRGDRMLSINLSRSEDMPVQWLTVCLESARVADDTPVVEVIDQTLAAHGHVRLPPCASLGEAVEQAEKYARWWRNSGATTEACDCEEIGE